MADFRHLTEARIRDFRKRQEAGEVRPASKAESKQSLETMLMSDIRDLRKRAQAASDAEQRDALLGDAQRLETQLMVLLESSGRPLAAKLMAERLHEPEPDSE